MKKLLTLFSFCFLIINAHAQFTSTQSGPWNDGATWGNTSPGVVGIDYPDNTADATVNHAITVNSNAACRNLTLGSGGEIFLFTGDLSINGPAVINNSTQPFTILSNAHELRFTYGTLTTVTLNEPLIIAGGSNTLFITPFTIVTLAGANSLSTNGSVAVDDNGILNANGKLVLRAASTSSFGRLKLNDENSDWTLRDEYTGTINGNVTVEKILETTLKDHLPAVAGAFNGTWFQMSMPVDVNAAGGALTGPTINFTDVNPSPQVETRNIWWYNNQESSVSSGYTKGWTRETSEVEFNKPYTIFLTKPVSTGGDVSPFGTTQTISATGTVNLGILPLNYTPTDLAYFADSAANPNPGTADNSGWAFIANPMPAYIDTYNWLRTPSAGSIAATSQMTLQYPAVHVYNSIDDQYEGWTTTELFGGNPWPVINYNTAGGINNNTDLIDKRIPPFQGFWVKADAISFLNDIDIERRTFTSDPGDGSNYQKTSTIIPETAALFVYDADSAKDITLVYYDDSKSNAFDNLGDAYKLFSFSNNAPSLWFTEAGSRVMSAGRPNSPSDTVDVHYFSYKNNSTAHLWLNDTNLSPSMDVMLYDKLTMQTQDMRANPSYQFTHNTSNQNDRFLLIFTNNAFDITEYNPEVKPMKVYSTGNELAIESVNYTGPAHLNMFDLAGRLILSREVDVTAGVTNYVQMPGLATSIYSVEINFGGKVMVEKIMR